MNHYIFMEQGYYIHQNEGNATCLENLSKKERSGK